MPCWEANVMAVEFSTRHEGVFQTALEMSGLEMVKGNWLDEEIWIVGPKGSNLNLLNDPIVIWPDKGQAKCQAGYEASLGNLRWNYSVAAVKKAAKKGKWSVSISTKNPSKIVARRY